MRNRLIDPLRIQERESHAKVRGSIVRLEPKHFTEFPQSLGVVPALQQGDPQVEPGDSIRRGQLDGLLKIFNSTIELSRSVQDKAELVVDSGIVRVVLQSRLVLGDRFLAVSLGVGNQAQIEMS